MERIKKAELAMIKHELWSMIQDNNFKLIDLDVLTRKDDEDSGAQS